MAQRSFSAPAISQFPCLIASRSWAATSWIARTKNIWIKSNSKPKTGDCPTKLDWKSFNSQLIICAVSTSSDESSTVFLGAVPSRRSTFGLPSVRVRLSHLHSLAPRLACWPSASWWSRSLKQLKYSWTRTQLTAIYIPYGLRIWKTTGHEWNRVTSRSTGLRCGRDPGGVNAFNN